MTDFPEPLTPADCDLRDYHFMQIEVKRLLTSETWVLGTGDERAAAIALWLESWHQVPAASLPDNDRMLAHLSQAKNWKRVKEHSLRGWVKCTDGKLYHPVVAEKALEAWISKLVSSLAGSAGNAKRWGIEVDTDSIKRQIIEAARLLQAIAPQSEWLRKKQVRDIVAGSPPDGKGIAPRYEKTSPPDSPPDRNREGDRERESKTLAQQHNHRGQSRAAEGPNDRAIDVAVLLRSLGVSPMTGQHPAAREFADTGATDAQLRAAVDIARERKPAPEPISPNYLRPILAEILSPPKPRAVKPPPLHAMTDAQLNAAGVQAGVGEARIGESRHEFIARIQTAQAIAQGRAIA
ncbi:YdaU family protein [Cupriavidus gilardii]|uniref:YdaU family protein n=1 Tax=Cupriavidus gilardii TaxID=82541 RepID=UPI0021C17545|nr:YdaU family protein [Cupriavidus gilardii]MCT9071208.1 YdaU family protein [Cupriavidus gilardii]